MNEHTQEQSPFEEVRTEIRRASGWTVFGGILMIFLGIMAISMPLRACCPISPVPNCARAGRTETPRIQTRSTGNNKRFMSSLLGSFLDSFD